LEKSNDKNNKGNRVIRDSRGEIKIMSSNNGASIAQNDSQLTVDELERALFGETIEPTTPVEHTRQVEEVASEKKQERKTEQFSDGLSRPFPAEHLPEALRKLADNVSEATNTPAVISYAAGLSAIAASTSGNLRVETKEGEFVAGNLYIIPIVESGIGKTRASKFMLKVLYNQHDSAQNEWKETSKEFQAELDAVLDEIEALKKQLSKTSEHHARQHLKADLAELYGQKEDCEKLLIKPELYTGSTTEAKLAALLRDNKEVMNAISTEAGAAVQILAGKYNNSDRGTVKTDDTLLLSGYSQERYKNDRLTTDSVELHGPTINLLWMIQPRYIPTLWGNVSLLNGGLLARALAFNSHAEAKEETGLEPEVSKDLLNKFSSELNSLFDYFRQTKTVITPSPEAKDVMRSYFNECVRLRNGSLRDINQFPARWTENAWKIAVCLHAMAYGKEAGNFKMPKKIATDAVEIMRWFGDEFLLLMKAGREDKLDADAQALVNYINRKGTVHESESKKSMALREVARNRSMKTADIRQIVESNPRSLRIAHSGKGDRISVI
jgi:hypothetical protein